MCSEETKALLFIPPRLAHIRFSMFGADPHVWNSEFGCGVQNFQNRSTFHKNILPYITAGIPKPTCSKKTAKLMDWLINCTVFGRRWSNRAGFDDNTTASNPSWISNTIRKQNNRVIPYLFLLFFVLSPLFDSRTHLSFTTNQILLVTSWSIEQSNWQRSESNQKA